jgi:aminopeptidase N
VNQLERIRKRLFYLVFFVPAFIAGALIPALYPLQQASAEAEINRHGALGIEHPAVSVDLPEACRGGESPQAEQTGKEKTMTWREEPVAVAIQELKTLSQAIEGVADKKIVYVGEFHDKNSHHAVQLEVIKNLHRRNPKLAVGMEMFQRPFQRVIDDYISGRIEEREFLKKTEYFERWGFDYNLYKPIIDFARSVKMPVVALNIRREIVDKVGREGLDSLSSDEKKEVPGQMDFSDTAYREKLEKVFKEHKGNSERKFEFFFQAQVLWDETMAMSIDEYLKKEPESRMVVLAGQGHLAYGSGIPKRAFRRNGFAYGSLLNDADPDRQIGDYVIIPQALEGKKSPKLMVALKEDKETVTITDLPEDSIARKAGLKAGDVIRSLDNEQMRSIGDIKIALFYKNSGDSVKVTAVRKRFFLGERELTFDIKLP